MIRRTLALLAALGLVAVAFAANTGAAEAKAQPDRMCPRWAYLVNPLCVVKAVARPIVGTAHVAGDVASTGAEATGAVKETVGAVHNIASVAEDGTSAAAAWSARWSAEQRAKAAAAQLPVCTARLRGPCLMPLPLPAATTTLPRPGLVTLPLCGPNVPAPCVRPVPK